MNLNINITNIVKTGIKVAVAVAVGAAATETLYHGCNMVESDIRLGKEIVSPTPISVKKGFRKRTTITVSPITGEVKPYTGSKEAIKTNYKLRKGRLV